MDRKQAIYGVVIAAAAMSLIFLFHHLFKHAEPEAAKGTAVEALRQAQPLPPNGELDKAFQRPVRTLAIKKPPPAAATLASPTRVAEMQSDPLPPPAIDAHPVKTEALTAATVKAETLAQHVIRQIEKPPAAAAEKLAADPDPIQLLRRPPRHQQNDDDDEPKHHSGGDGVCAKYGGHKVTFHRRSGWESWRCVYPHRHRND